MFKAVKYNYSIMYWKIPPRQPVTQVTTVSLPEERLGPSQQPGRCVVDLWESPRSSPCKEAVRNTSRNNGNDTQQLTRIMEIALRKQVSQAQNLGWNILQNSVSFFKKKESKTNFLYLFHWHIPTSPPPPQKSHAETRLWKALLETFLAIFITSPKVDKTGWLERVCKLRHPNVNMNN